MSEPVFAALGDPTDDIEVRLSYRIVELFSEGLYTSPNKAVEELVANSFDAGALQVHVLLSSNLHDQDATIAVFDDGDGMDHEGLKRHWTHRHQQQTRAFHPSERQATDRQIRYREVGLSIGIQN